MTTFRTFTIWALLDDRPGNTTQSLGVARALGGDVVEKRLYFNAAARLPNLLRHGPLLGVNFAISDALDEGPVPDVVIAAGRRLAPVLAQMKCYYPDAYTVQLMSPDGVCRRLDLIVRPKHDQASDKESFLTLGAPHQITQAKITDHAAKLALKLHLRGSPTALIIGGSTDHGAMTVADMERLWERLAPLLGQGTLLVTTSRRTPPAVVGWLRRHVTPPQHLWPYGEAENPYPGLLGLADRIVVTGDSVSMLSEACITGKPVYAFDELLCLKPKHRCLIEQLAGGGYLRRLADASPDWIGGSPLNEAERVAAEIQRRLASRA